MILVSLKLAWRSLFGAGLRTWLNVAVLAMALLVIVWMQGMIEGWNRQARRDTIAWEIGGGQVCHAAYDRYDPLSFVDARAVPSGELAAGIADGDATPILVAQVSIYPEGRMRGAIMRGIDVEQDILAIPGGVLRDAAAGMEGELPVLIGEAMARSTGLSEGDTVSVRWRDARGAFDAIDATIAGIFDCDVPTVDAGQVWVSIDRLREMLQLPGAATLVVMRQGVAPVGGDAWRIYTAAELLSDFDAMIRQKSVGSSVMYAILLALAMLAVFDTQVLAVFRRQREIGTQIALGMTRWQVVMLFTFEGAMYGILAVALSAVIGGPLLWWQAVAGFSLPEFYGDYGLAIGDAIYPVYPPDLLLKTAAVILAMTTVVSFIPARRIAGMRPTDAIRGRVS